MGSLLERRAEGDEVMITEDFSDGVVYAEFYSASRNGTVKFGPYRYMRIEDSAVRVCDQWDDSEFETIAIERDGQWVLEGTGERFDSMDIGFRLNNLVRGLRRK